MTPKRRSRQRQRRNVGFPEGGVGKNSGRKRGVQKRKSMGHYKQKPSKSPLTLKRNVTNEYAGNLQPVPLGFQHMSHSSRTGLIYNNSGSFPDVCAILPTTEFHSHRTFTSNKSADGVRNINVETSTEENVSRGLQSLNLQDDANAQNNNNKSEEKSDTIIVIPDSPTITKDTMTFEGQNHKAAAPNDNDVICLDDTRLTNDCSDVIFVGNKRKSTGGSTPGGRAKRRKTEASVIVIDDDGTPRRRTRNERRKASKLNARKRKMKQRITRSSGALTRSGFNFLATSTPNKTGAHCCIATPSLATAPSLATIPEEPGDKKQQNVTPDGLEQTRSLLEYNDLDILGSNFLSAGPIRNQGLRPIFIDGSNIAMGHSNGRYFSVKGLKICVDYFLKRGHEVTAIVPMFRKKRSQNSDPALLRRLEAKGLVVFTPARTINGRHIVPYDDRYVVLMAAVHKGIVVSSDNFQDLLAENPQMAETIERRVLNPTWMKDMIIFPMDPLGRGGPPLKEFLQFP